MTHIVLLISMCCVAALLSVGEGLPVYSEVLTNSEDPHILDPRFLSKRTTADTGLSSQRSQRLADLMRKYALLTIMESMKSKRSGGVKYPRKSDGSIDYKAIEEALEPEETQQDPWFIVDAKREILNDDRQRDYMILDNKDNWERILRQKTSDSIGQILSLTLEE